MNVYDCKFYEYQPMKEQYDPNAQITLRMFSVEESTDIKYYVAELLYWATFIGNYEIVNLFIVKLGFSPFINLFKGQTPVHAAILTQNFEMYEYLVKNVHHGLAEVYV